MQYLVNGVTIGAVYALFAVSFSLIFGVLDILNLSIVSLFTLATYVAFFLTLTGLSWPLAALAGAVVAGVLGVLGDQVALRPLAGRRGAGLQSLVAAIGLGTILDAVVLGWAGPDPVSVDASALPSAVWHPFGDLTITLAQVLCLAATVVAMGGLGYALARTSWGRRVRAIAENPFAAQVAGVDLQGTRRSTVLVSALLAGVAGLLFVMQFDNLTPDLGHAVELKGLAAIIIGGMASVPGAALGGLLLGLVEVGTTVAVGAGWKDAAAFLAIVVVLLLKPTGLFGAAAAREA